MNYAIIISLVLHLLAFSYMIWGSGRPQQNAYPKIMNVDLVSLPPISRGISAGTENPGTPQTETVKPKAETKVEQKPETPHLAQVEKQKKPSNPKKPKPKPQTKAEQADKEVKAEAKGPAGEDKERFGLPQGVETGSEFGSIRLDGASFETPTYLNIVFAKIKNRWDNPFQGAEKTVCIIYFTILQNGTVTDAIVEQSSGIPAFDQSALRAVMSASPPPLPLEYSGNQLGIHLQFQYLP